MRRPRGPGGRFLTAEEIAAQKTAQVHSLGPGAIHSPSHDNDDEGDDDEAAHIVFDESQSLPRNRYQDGGSLANALSSNPRQHMPQPQSQQMQYATNLSASSTPMTMQATYPTMQQMHPPPQPTIHYANGLYSNTDGVNDSEMRRRTEEIMHFGARGGGPGGS
jgi:nuclear transcription factor Y alpha